MKRMLIAFLVIMSATLMLSSCDKEASANPDDPLMGEWKMTRLSFDPSLPVPDLVLSRVIPEGPTWTIARAASGPTITFDGHEIWFNTPSLVLEGVSVDKNPTTVDVGTSNASLIFKNGGDIYVKKVRSVPGLDLNVEQISITYQDTVSIVSASLDTLTATIIVNVSGKYFHEGAERMLSPYRATITYSGKRK